MLDFIGIGFGPSNLALAIATRELAPRASALFFERNAAFQWHPGMMLDGARMQISFLKDLVSLRNLASPFTFLQYTKARGRLERFVNLREFHPTRLEYQDYLAWVADAFAEQVRYGTSVTRVMPDAAAGEPAPSRFRVEVRGANERETVYFARNVVQATGGTPRLAAGPIDPTTAVMHSSDFLHRFPAYFADASRAWEFAVVGDGQSAGEIVAYLLRQYPRARVHLVIFGYALRATDSSPFVNEQFSSAGADAFYRSSEAKRSALREELRDTNYGVVDPGLLDELYRTVYLDEVKGQQRMVVHSCSQLGAIDADGSGVRATIEDRFGGPAWTLRCDGLVLATGYRRGLDPAIFGDLLPFIETDAAGDLVLSPACRVQTTTGLACGLYVQGYGESSFGLGDTLLSLMPFRSRDILYDICPPPPAVADALQPPLQLTQIEYPPARHLEPDLEKLYAVIERFKFATLISAPAADEPVVTHVPLILDRARGDKGVLFGHMDRANPHVNLLEGRRVLALFHGPNTYVSPHVYETNQLPTWNSITVHVRGRARIVSDRLSLVGGLCRIAETSDPDPGAYRLSASDPRIERLVEFIVGFEIEIDELVGRFKLSQDRSDSDRQRAAVALARRTELGERALIERIVGLTLTAHEQQNGSPFQQAHGRGP